MDEPGVPLSHYRDNHAGAGVRFHCCACQASHDVPIERVIARLQARGVGGADTGVRAVAKLSDRPCARCGAIRWETRPALSLEAKAQGR